MYMPFGKHRGCQVEDVPHSYLLWVLDNCENISPTLRNEIQRVLGVGRPRENPHASPPPRGAALAVDTAKDWYRRLAIEFHPDRGGSHEVMKAVNRGFELLTEMIGVHG